jgi:hypothetical protein
MTPQRSPFGINTCKKTDALGMLPIPDPTRLHVFMDDFDKYLATDWIITTAESQAGDATEAVANAKNGVLVITNDDRDDDNDFFQHANETFKFTAGKQTWFKVRAKASDVTQSDLVFGLQITDTAPLAVTDGVFFRKDDGAATIDVFVVKDSTTTTAAAVATMVADTFIELAFYYNGKDSVEFFVNDVKVATLATTNLPDDEEMTISFGIQNGAVGAKVLSVDYILVAEER